MTVPHLVPHSRGAWRETPVETIALGVYLETAYRYRNGSAGRKALFDGRDYNQQFNEACSDLAHESDEDTIRATLCGIEWVLAEAIRGTLFLTAVLQAGLVALPISWAFNVRDMDWIGKALLSVLFIGYAALSYWLSRFIFWHEISRHVKPRRFGVPWNVAP